MGANAKVARVFPRKRAKNPEGTTPNNAGNRCANQDLPHLSFRPHSPGVALGANMSDAGRILEERLARGEITEAEYDRLKAKLSASAPSEAATPRPTATPAPARARAGGGFLSTVVGGAVGLYGAAVILLAFVTPPAEITQNYYEGCMKNRGNSVNFCQCIATELSNGLNIFSAPLHLVGIGRTPGPTASYTCNNR